MRVIIPIVALMTIAGLVLLAQQESDDVRRRRVWDLNLQKDRPPAPTSTRRKPEPASKRNNEDSYVGVTLWRLRPSKNDDEPAARMLVHPSAMDKDEDWTPVRCEANTALSQGDMVRLSIESARPGYLYVADREKYADGTYGEANLIFPTLRTRRGVNQVKPGEIVEIPSWDDSPRYFLARRNRTDQVAEVLTVIVAPEPIKGLRIGPEPAMVSNQQIISWEANWGVEVEELEAVGQVGKPYTSHEADAGRNLRILNSDDPLPQTIFLIKAKPGDPLLVTVTLTMK